jgi:thiamine-phosphate pyrophosphorylase
MKKSLGRGLYGMLDLPEAVASQPAASLLASARRIYEPLLASGVSLLQLRMKGATATAMLTILEELLARRPAATRIIVNDRLDVALCSGADGVHLGQDDLPLSAAQRVVNACGRHDFLIGISTHDEEQAAAAQAGGADYIALGPIYATQSKLKPDPIVGPQRLAALCRGATCPVVAIGGITLDRLPEIVAAGAPLCAIISAVNGAADIARAAAAVQSHFS